MLSAILVTHGQGPVPDYFPGTWASFDKCRDAGMSEPSEAGPSSFRPKTRTESEAWQLAVVCFAPSVPPSLRQHVMVAAPGCGAVSCQVPMTSEAVWFDQDLQREEEGWNIRSSASSELQARPSPEQTLQKVPLRCFALEACPAGAEESLHIERWGSSGCSASFACQDICSASHADGLASSPYQRCP